MSSRCPERVLRAFVVVGALAVAPACARELVVCADPDDLPYSKQDGSGFENRVAEIVAHELGAGRCDMLAGVPVGLEGVATTAPYYRSGYAFVYRRDEASPLRSFDDPRLRRAKIGIQLVGADMAATPAALALARRGIVANVVGFPVYGAEVAAQRMIAALDAGSIDVAVIWGAQAGYFAQRAQHPLAVSIAHDDAPAPQVFAIALGVRRDRTALRDELDAALVRARDRIRAILDAFDVPRVEPAAHIAERPR